LRLAQVSQGHFFRNEFLGARGNLGLPGGGHTGANFCCGFHDVLSVYLSNLVTSGFLFFCLPYVS
jgi:hypothetical protein